MFVNITHLQAAAATASHECTLLEYECDKRSLWRCSAIKVLVECVSAVKSLNDTDNQIFTNLTLIFHYISHFSDDKKNKF